MQVHQSVVLTEDLHCPGGGFALMVLGSGVTIDLGGHTISGEGSLAVFADQGVSDLVVKNGTIQQVRQAAFLGSTTGAVIDDLRVRDVTHAWAVEAGEGTTVSNSHFEGTVIAVSLFYGSNAVVRDSTFSGNVTGVFLEDGRGHVVTRNRFSDNGREGVRLADSGAVRDSVVTRNRFEGNGFGMWWRAEFWTTGNEVSHNHFVRNRHSGMLVVALRDGDVLDGTAIAHNRFDRNGSEPLEFTEWVGGVERTFVAADGLAVLAPSEPAAAVTVTGNHAFHNAGFGIHAAGVTDGGRNHARHNGEPDQCVGLRCTPGNPR